MEEERIERWISDLSYYFCSSPQTEKLTVIFVLTCIVIEIEILIEFL